MTEFKIFGDHDDNTKRQMARCMSVGSVAGGVLCADGHLGYAQPVGGVIAYEEQISVSGVGFDIGCGNMAVRLDVKREAIADEVGPILADMARNVSFVDCEAFEIGEGAVAQGALVSSAQDHAGCVAGLEGFLPTRRAQAPTISGFQAGKAVVRHRCREIVAA